MDFIIKQLIPCQGIGYVADYFTDINNQQLNQKQMKGKFAFIFIAMAIQGVHFLFQYLTPNMHPLYSIIHGDYARFGNLSPIVYYIYIFKSLNNI